ncbi:MAG: glycosyltransferase family 87 protein [Pseudomonadota bacterium]
MNLTAATGKPEARIDSRVMAVIGMIGLAMTAYVLGAELFDGGKTKDYPLWYDFANRIMAGEPLYDSGRYLYPPTMVVLLAPFSFLTPALFYAFLIVLSVGALYLCVLWSMRLSAGDKPLPWQLALVPIIMMLPQIFENFDLGQPHIILLAIMLAGFGFMREGKPLAAGAMFGLAAALKVFPISILPYLIWRRYWKAAGSMVAALMIILVVLPSPIRGYERNLNELSQWFVAMAGDEDGFGQREQQNWSWKNQSVVAITHRLVRDIDYKKGREGEGDAKMNITSVDYRTANYILLGVIAVIGLMFIAILLPRGRLDQKRLAEEWGILLCLMTIASPLSRTYYFIWLLFPLFVLVQRSWDSDSELTKKWIRLGLIAVFVFTLLQLINELQAFGVNTLAAVLVMGMLAWIMRTSPPTPRGKA